MEKKSADSLVVDVTISMLQPVNSITDLSKLGLLERFSRQSLGRSFGIRPVADGRKRLDVPAHENSTVGVPAIDEARVGQLPRLVTASLAGRCSTSSQRKRFTSSLEALYFSVESDCAAASRDVRRAVFLVGKLGTSGKRGVAGYEALRPRLWAIFAILFSIMGGLKKSRSLAWTRAAV